jgi:RHS repeat-associated protein
MELASSAFSTGVPLSAAIPQLAGNSRQGFGLRASTMRWASGWVISSTALGFSGSLYDGDVRSCCPGKERDSESGNDYFGARYYASTMGRFLSPDWSAKVVPVPYAKLDDPQSLNLYSYVRNNPLSRVDKDGHCSSPSVGKGQVGVCIDLYIQAKTINLVGQGDGRGPAANDPKATYRVELQLVMDPKAGTVSLVKDDAGVSKALGGLISNKGTDSTSPITPTTDANGTTHFTINNTALNGLHDLPGAPQDTIKTTINMDVTSGGKVGIEGGERTAYPSLEIYSYNPSGQPTTILQMQEHNPSDLAKQNQQIPQVAPQ